MNAEQDSVHEAAADWLIRVQDPAVTLEETLEWQEWMKADSRNTEAFRRLEEVSMAVRRVRLSHGKPGTRQFARDKYDGSVPLGEWRPARSKWPLAMAASVVVSLLAPGWLIYGAGFGEWWSFPWQTAPKQTVLATVLGENRTFALEDGSRVTLGGSSQVVVALSKGLRALDLQRGEAFFVVAKDRARPFRVHAGELSVTAVGTKFNVRRDSDRAVVAVTEGRVLVEPAPHVVPVALLREFKPKMRPVGVAAGEQTSAGSAGVEEASKMDDVAEMTSWQSGRLAFRLEALKYVVEDVNRYARKPIVLGDENIGDLLITGTVTGANVEGWIGSLERAFGLVAVEENERIVLKRGK